MEDGSKQALDSPKDNPKEPVDNTIVWIQSFIPAIGAVFKFGTLVMILINEIRYFFVRCVTFGLSCMGFFR